jgi:Skp family chaperone for outer membrane proteins
MYRAILAGPAALALCALLAATACAQGLPVGVVSIGDVLSKSTKIGQAKQQLQKLVDQKNAQLQAEIQSRFITSLFSPDELEEAQALLAKEDRSAADTTRVQDLTNLSTARQRELQSLQQKPDAQLTDEQRQRMSTLLAWRRAAADREQQVKDLQQGMQQEVDDAQNKALESWQRQVLDAVAQVARDNKLLLVFEAESLPYWDPALAITDKVIAILDAPPTTPPPSS